MPIYDFRDELGNTIEKVVPVGTTKLVQNGKSYKKVPVPSGFSFIGRAVGVVPQGEQVKAGYHKLEQDKGSRFLDRSPFTAKQIKKAWGF